MTTPSTDLDFAVLLLLLLLLLLLSALARASSAAPRSSFSNRPCVAASMVVGKKREMAGWLSHHRGLDVREESTY